VVAKAKLTGVTSHLWTVLGPAEQPEHGTRSDKYRAQTWWLCECRCGTRRPVARQSLQTGASRSCGCLVIANNRARTGTKRTAKAAGTARQTNRPTSLPAA
jgi:hypothetical protein